MKLQTTQTTKQDIEIKVPAFYKDDRFNGTINHIRAILDEKTCVDVFESNTRTAVSNGDTSMYGNEIIEAQLNWQPISETEFLTAYNRALNSMSLTPELSKESELNGLFTSTKEENII